MNLANQISIARILLVPFFVCSIVYFQPDRPWLKLIAIATFLIASVTDAVDGYIARVRNEISKLGMLLDPLADKLLLISAFLCLHYASGFAQKMPPWVLIVILSREVLILSGILVIFFTTSQIQIQPSLSGKMTTVIQMCLVLALLLELPWASWLWYGAAGLTIISGISYVIREGRKMNHGGPVKGEISTQHS